MSGPRPRLIRGTGVLVRRYLPTALAAAAVVALLDLAPTLANAHGSPGSPVTAPPTKTSVATTTSVATKTSAAPATTTTAHATTTTVHASHIGRPVPTTTIVPTTVTRPAP